MDVLHSQALCDLQIDAGRRNAVDDRAFHHADEVALPQLDRRNVYRDPGWLEFLLDPAAVIERSALEGPRADWQDQAGLLEQRYEFHRRWRDHAGAIAHASAPRDDH